MMVFESKTALRRQAEERAKSARERLLWAAGQEQDALLAHYGNTPTGYNEAAVQAQRGRFGDYVITQQ